jgi:hypothetical protein
MAFSFWICAGTGLPALVLQCLMGTLVIVKVEVVLQCREEIEAGGEVSGVDEFVLERAPQSFDKYVVQRAAPSIHADGNAALFERS